jgi:hypothetical protein
MLDFSGFGRSALALVLLSGAALAQPNTAPTNTPPPPVSDANKGTGPVTTNPAQVDKGQNMILPSAGSSGQSAAPTMVFDCKAKPQDCTTPATPADKVDAPAVSPAPPTSTPAKP